ncbi:MAG TPA: DUF6603 domain-containing protein, partial [Bacteroidia bacterium]|nr:DUF6603 domain-containing protein [Bacteroidia bacterium]
MTLLDEIADVIRKKKVDDAGNLTISAADFNLPYTDHFFKTVLRVDPLIISGYEKQESNEAITLSGKVAIWNHPVNSFTLRFETQSGSGVKGTAALNFPPENKTNLPLLEWIKLSKGQLIASSTEKFRNVSFGYACEIMTGNSEEGIPVSILREGEDKWRIDIADQAGKNISGSELAVLLGSPAMANILPESLIKGLDVFAITGIHSLFDTHQKEVSLFQIGVSITRGWEITPKVKLDPGLHFSLTLLNATDSNTRIVTVMMNGTLQIGDVPVPLFIGTRSYHRKVVWSFGIQPGKSIALPGLSELLKLVEGDDAFATLPDGLKNLPKIVVQKLSVDFDPNEKKLSRLAFDVEAASWEIIPNYFSITRLGVELEITNVTDSETRQINGSVIGVFVIGDVSLMCEIEKTVENPDWTITAGLAPGRTIDLSKIASQLFGKNKVPEGVPHFSFSQLQITVVPKTKSFTFSAQSTDTWKFTEHISASDVQLKFKRDPQNTQNPVSGHFVATLAVGTTEPVKITLSAALGETAEGGSLIEGSTNDQPIEIGHLIKYLATSFNNDAKVPDWLNGIQLSNLGVGYHTGTGDLHFEVTGKIPVADHPLVIKITFRYESDGNGGHTRHIEGKLTIGKDAEVTLSIDSSSSDTQISGEWSATTTEGNLRFEDLADKLGFHDLPAIPDALKFALTNVSFLYDSSKKQVVIAAKTAGKSAAVFVASTLRDKSRFYGFGAKIQLNVRLADIPLVGDKIPGADNIGIPEATAWILSAPLIADDVTDINNIISKKELPVLPAGPLQARVLLHAVLHLGATQEKPIDLALGNTTPHISLATTTNAEPPSTPTWIDIQKQFGIFIFNRIGFAYHDNQLQFLLDAGMEMGPLSFTLDGLSISSPLTAFKPKFDISGLGLAYHQGSLDIEGAFLKLPKEQLDPDTNFQFDGLAIIKAGKFSLSAVGSYAQLKSGDPSMFLFVQVEAPLGGPPAFFITGVMGGFGFNRSLALPGMDEVTAFPLLSLAEPSSPGENAATQNPMHVLDVLSGRAPAKDGQEKRVWIAASAGEYWLALGLQFTSFQIVKSRALLIAEFGHDLSFALLGISTLQLPQTSDGKYPYVSAELQLRAILQPTEGFFGLSAILSGNSFVLTPDCHLTGGFAFYFWFGSHAMSGQFVVSMGGYHPAFDKPKDYPALPRLGFNWAVSSSITIKGGAYFALTPSCVMAGGALEALFHDGCVKAWFTAHADFLIS